MYFNIKSVSDPPYLKVKGLTPTPSDDYIYLSFSQDRLTQYTIGSGEKSSWNGPLKYYCSDGSQIGYYSLLDHLLCVQYRGPGYDTITVYDSLGNQTTGDIVLFNQYSNQVTVYNRTSSSINCAYVKVRVPEVLYSLTPDGTDGTFRAKWVSLYYKGSSNPAYCSDSRSPWSYKSIHVTDFKFFNSNDEEVPFEQSESVYMAKDGNYINLCYDSQTSITAAYVKFKFPFPELA